MTNYEKYKNAKNSNELRAEIKKDIDIAMKWGAGRYAVGTAKDDNSYKRNEESYSSKGFVTKDMMNSYLARMDVARKKGDYDEALNAVGEAIVNLDIYVKRNGRDNPRIKSDENKYLNAISKRGKLILDDIKREKSKEVKKAA